MTLYKGSQKIRDTGDYGVYHGSEPIGAIYHGNDLVYIFKKSTTWQAGTSLARYQVSPWCTKLRVDCVGSKGFNGDRTAGKGGRVQCEMTVTPNQILYITVGASPTSQTAVYNAADIRTNNAGITNTTSLQSRLIVAGGGGNGASAYSAGNGGNGGGTTGQAGASVTGGGGGGGGTQTAGGAGGSYASYFGGGRGEDGKFGLGGNRNGGRGGAGWYGGGSGGAGSYGTNWAGGGGGGSSYTSSACSNVVHTQGYQNGAGYITITEIG